MGPSPTLVGNRRKFTSRLIVNHLSRNNAEFSQPLRSFGTAAPLAPFLLDEPIRVASEKALAAKAVLKAKVGRPLGSQNRPKEHPVGKKIQRKRRENVVELSSVPEAISPLGTNNSTPRGCCEVSELCLVNVLQQGVV